MQQEDRIQRLEEKIAFQEQTIADLDQVVQALNASVENLRRELREHREAMATPIDPDRKPEEDVPPHYGRPIFQ